ncbi:hypothetical protein Tco_0179316 [Tanacetum coccineum]
MKSWILKDGGEDFRYSDTERLSRSDKVLKLKNFKKDATLKLSKSTNQEWYEHVGPRVKRIKMTKSQDVKTRLYLVDDLTVLKITSPLTSHDLSLYKEIIDIVVMSDQWKRFKLTTVRVTVVQSKKMVLLLHSAAYTNEFSTARWEFVLLVGFHRFYTSAGNPVKEILLKLNLPDHRKLKDGGKASSQGQASSLTYADDVMFSFFANQSNSPQLDNEDLDPLHPLLYHHMHHQISQFLPKMSYLDH